MPLSRLLVMVEKELCQMLVEKIDSLPAEKRKGSSLEKWKNEAECRLARLKDVESDR
ncbi:MAG: hypothetical protein ACOCTL_04140 [Candidatus Hadarchaeota archaeon]